MESYFMLDIGCVQENSKDEISKILNLEPNFDGIGAWSYETKDNNFISIFINILNDKYDKLKSIGIERGDITVWFVYYYEHQCNMEFNPQEMMKLGNNGITLCISCYDVGTCEDEEDETNDDECIKQ